MNNWYKNYKNERMEKEASFKHGLAISMISFLSGISAWFEADQIRNFLDNKNVPYEIFVDKINEINQTNKSLEEIDKSDVILAKQHLDSESELVLEPEQHNEYVDIDRLLDILQVIESNNNPKAVGDNGNAYGILQIWKSVITDVNRIYGTDYTHEDAFNPVKARDIAKKYLEYYGKIYTRNEQANPDYEVLARIWNGGPQGYKNSRTNDYWNKVKPNLNEI